MMTVWAWSLILQLLYFARLCNSIRCEVQYGIEYCLMKCDTTPNCPTWMYCDTSLETGNCVPCSICRDDYVTPRDRKECTDAPLRCLPTMGTSLSRDFLCSQLRVLDTAACHGHCYSGSVRYFSPLGTTCVITCTGNHDNRPPTPTVRQYNFTCVWENDVISGGKAEWKPESLPDEITTYDRATMVTTDTDHSSTQSASGPVDLSWTYLLIFFITVLVMCCLIIVGFSVVVLLHVVRRRVKISLRRIGNVDGDNAESAARSSGSSPSDESSPDTVASSSESRGPVMTCQEQRLLRPTAVELSDDEDDTSGIATQPTPSSSVNHEPRSFSFHSDFMSPLDDRRHGSRYHGDVATLACGRVRCDYLNNNVDRRRRQSDELFDRVSLRTDETRCKEVDCS